MFRFIAVFAVIILSASAAPKPSVFAASTLAVAPAIAPAIVTAQSSQVIARNYNALAAPLVAAAPAVAPVLRAAPLVASPYVASPYVASPYAASPYVASPYAHAPYVAPAAPFLL